MEEKLIQDIKAHPLEMRSTVQTDKTKSAASEENKKDVKYPEAERKPEQPRPESAEKTALPKGNEKFIEENKELLKKADNVLKFVYPGSGITLEQLLMASVGYLASGGKGEDFEEGSYDSEPFIGDDPYTGYVFDADDLVIPENPITEYAFKVIMKAFEKENGVSL